MLEQLKKEVLKLADTRRAEANKWFFKTGKGEYGEGDEFAGLSVPVCREIAKKFKDLSLPEVKQLLKSPIHEERLISLFILINRYKKADPKLKKEIFDFYLQNTKLINNWDLVDSSAHYIIGEYLLDKPRDVLYKLAQSENLWERRIAIISTFAFIRKNEFKDALKIAKLLLDDERALSREARKKHDLIHKAVGWVLREIGKKDNKQLVSFLEQHYKYMPRTMLRYSIEKFQEDLRKKYLNGLV